LVHATPTVSTRVLSPLLLHCSPAPLALPSFPTRRSSDLPPLCRSRDRSCRLRPSCSRTTAPTSPSRTCTRRACAFNSHLAQSGRSEEHTSEFQSQSNLVCRLLLEKKKNK